MRRALLVATLASVTAKSERRQSIDSTLAELDGLTELLAPLSSSAAKYSAVLLPDHERRGLAESVKQCQVMPRVSNVCMGAVNCAWGGDPACSGKDFKEWSRLFEPRGNLDLQDEVQVKQYTTDLDKCARHLRHPRADVVTSSLRPVCAAGQRDRVRLVYMPEKTVESEMRIWRASSPHGHNRSQACPARAAVGCGPNN